MVCLQRSIYKAVPFLLAAASIAVAQTNPQPKFLDGDPLLTVPEVASAQNANLLGIDDLYDFIVESAHAKSSTATPTLGINTMDEVPDSSWFTNRQALHPMPLEKLKKGARVHGAPVAPFAVTATKTAGVTPGFRIRDSRGYVYFVKVDPLSNPEMATASDVIGSLFLYAAGYNVPENYILIAKRSDFTIDPKATFSEPNGKKHPLTREDLRKVAKRMPIGPDGQLRLMASLQLEGKILGPFRYSGLRSDDPNDLIPHEQRRDLRGLAVICAWLNHTDAKADNTMDTLIGRGQNARIRHNLMDFGAAFGSDSDIAKDPRHGQEFFLPTTMHQGSKVVTLGLKPDSWETVHYPHHLPGVGNFASDGFTPATWKPNYPNPAFLRMNADDAYWGAKIVMSFSDADIRAIVDEGRFTNPEAADYITKTLERRRDLTGEYWLNRALSVEHPRVENDRLVFDELPAQSRLSLSPVALTYAWARYNNEHNQATAVPGSTAAIPPSLLADTTGYVRCTLREAAGSRFANVYLKRTANDWSVVGLERGPFTQNK